MDFFQFFRKNKNHEKSTKNWHHRNRHKTSFFSQKWTKIWIKFGFFVSLYMQFFVCLWFLSIYANIHWVILSKLIKNKVCSWIFFHIFQKKSEKPTKNSHHCNRLETCFFFKNEQKFEWILDFCLFIHGVFVYLWLLINLCLYTLSNFVKLNQK